MDRKIYVCATVQGGIIKGDSKVPFDTFVSDSLIENAGLGLFAGRKFKVGERVCYYGGELKPRRGLTAAQRHYSVAITEELVRDASSPDDPHPGRFVNHGSPANVKWCIDKRNKVASFKATKTIQAGSEIYVSYGVDYWKEHAADDSGLYGCN